MDNNTISILKKKFHQAIEEIDSDYFKRMNIRGSRGNPNQKEIEAYKVSLHKNFSKNHMSYINSLKNQFQNHIDNKTEFTNLKTGELEILSSLPIGEDWLNYKFEL